MTKRPDLLAHSDETVLSIMRCENHAEVRVLARELGISRGMADYWFYRATKRAVLLAHQHNLPPVRRPVESARGNRPERDLIRAIMAGDA